MSIHRQTAAAGAALGLAAGLLLGAGVVLARGPAAAETPGTSSTLEVAPVTVPPAGSMGGGTAASGPAVGPSAIPATAAAFPYYGGTPGIAPDDTIVVTGVGQADLKSDGSDRATAEKTAIADALADARTQADAIASGTGLSISGVLSVSASLSPAYGIMPMAPSGSGVACPVEPGATGKASGGGQSPELVCPPAYQPTLAVAVTVAYRVA